MASSERFSLSRREGAASAIVDPSAVPGAFGSGGAATQDPTRHVALDGNGLKGCFVDPAACDAVDGGRQHTQYPYVTGTSVLGLKFKGGVMIACDTLGAYGSTKRYKSVERIKEVGPRTILGASGEISDFHYIVTLLDELRTQDFCLDDGITMCPSETYAYLSRVMYNRRNKFDPLWNSLLVAGIEESGEPFLGSVGMIGVHYADSCVATGFARHLAMPLFRDEHDPEMSEADAEELMKKALTVCYYRDKNSINKFLLSTVTADGIKTKGPFSLKTEWGLKAFINPTKDSVGGW